MSVEQQQQRRVSAPPGVTSFDGAGFLFSPIANLTTGSVVGVEMLVRPGYAIPGEQLDEDFPDRRRPAADIALAAAALRGAIDAGVRQPIHLNLRAETVAGPPESLAVLHAALCETRTLPGGVVIEIGALEAGGTEPGALLAGARLLRARGYGVLLDWLTTHDSRMPLVLAQVVDQVKLHPQLLTGLADDSGLRGLMGVIELCRGAGAEVIADGIATVNHLEPLRAQRVQRGQGTLLAAPGGRPSAPLLALGQAAVPAVSEPVPAALPAAHTVAAFAGAATVLRQDVTGEQVREVFRDHQDETVVVLVDTEGRPVGSIDRNRFMLAMSGQFGHALHSARPALRMADQPRVLPSDASAHAALHVLARGEPARRNDDIVVVDSQGRCVGVAHVTDLLRGLAETAHERALVLDPATRLGGLAVLRPALVRRISGGRGFAVGWLVPELGPVLEREGFHAAETAMRNVAEAVRTAVGEDSGTEIGHVLGGLVVLTGIDRSAAIDCTARRLLGKAYGPALCSAWLVSEPGTSPTARAVDSALAGLLARAKAHGPDTSLTSVLERPLGADATQPTHLPR